MVDWVRVGDGQKKGDFEHLLAERFPEIAAEIDGLERDSLHLEMALFARATREAIDSGDFEKTKLHLEFIDELLSGAGPDLENAIYVSYLEDVFLSSADKNYVTARRMLSDRLETVLAELGDDWRIHYELDTTPEKRD